MRRLGSAIVSNRIDKVRSLIEHGANPELDKGLDYRPLIFSIIMDRLEIANFLIEVGANTTKPEEGRTPLDHAIIRGRSLAMVKLLLENGADLAMDESLVAAIRHTTNPDQVSIIQELIKHGTGIVNRPNSDSELPIICAVRTSKLEIVKLLFENGANLNVADSKGYTPLITSALRNNRNCDVLKFLVENGANVNFVNGEGETALVKCVRLINIPAIKCLIANKADVNVKNADDQTPLSITLSNVDLRTFKLLIEAGADPELASEAIEATSNKYFQFAAYISELRETKNVKQPQLKDFTGHEAAAE